jgi:hypothetical protein
MATKKQIAEQAMRILSGGHLKVDRTLDIREVMLNLDQIRDKIVAENTYKNIKQGLIEVDEDYLSFHENINLGYDLGKDLRYATLPVDTISLPRGLGLYQITPTNDVEDVFIIITAGQVGLLSGSQAVEHELKTYCWQVGNKVYFKNIDPSIVDITAILVASSKSIAETADYPLAPNDEEEALKRLIEIFSIHQKAPHDEIEDGKK